MSAVQKPRTKAVKRPRSATAPERTMTAFRCDVDQLAEITRRAAAARMTRTDYILAAALGTLPDEQNATLKRFEAIEQRLDRLEVSIADR